MLCIGIRMQSKPDADFLRLRPGSLLGLSGTILETALFIAKGALIRSQLQGPVGSASIAVMTISEACRVRAIPFVKSE